MNAPLAPKANAADIILAYHQRTKHSLQRFAAGPETLDWDAQPNPFREFSGSEKLLLPLSAETFSTAFGGLYETNGVIPAPLTQDSSARSCNCRWDCRPGRNIGPDRWALRCNPSSGNLHPTEAYVLARGIAGIADGLHHYRRAAIIASNCAPASRPQIAAEHRPRLWLGLSSIHWREAWKYGERAFRYCQLDLGHAIGALRYAAAVLGWKVTMREGMSSADAAALLGLDRADDFAGGAEHEVPDVILKDRDRCANDVNRHAIVANRSRLSPQTFSEWCGRANFSILGPCTNGRSSTKPLPRRENRSCLRAVHRANHPGIGAGSPEKAASVILNRRSAQAFDRQASMGIGAFYHLVDRLFARPVTPWDIWTYAPRLHPVFMLHRVDGLEPGLYIFIRNPDAEMRLRQAMRKRVLVAASRPCSAALNFYPAVCRRLHEICADIALPPGNRQ